jgi:hypothetical protein
LVGSVNLFVENVTLVKHYKSLESKVILNSLGLSSYSFFWVLILCLHCTYTCVLLVHDETLIVQVAVQAC